MLHDLFSFPHSFPLLRQLLVLLSGGLVLTRVYWTLHSLPGSVTSCMPCMPAGPAHVLDELALSSSVVQDLMVSLPARPERKL